MLLSIKNLYKSFNDTVVLNDVNFSGEVVSLVGQSGAGKTTVMRCVAGLEKCDEGTIEINGRFICRTSNGTTSHADKKELAEIRKDIGMVFQSYHLFPHLTVMENVALALTEVYKANNKPSQLSGGQKQRVAIARSCVTNPKLLCFDEPTAALDSALVTEIVKIIRRFASENGMGILIISHDERFVRDVSDRVLFIEKGRITKELTAEEYKAVMRE